jgi:hypothetical protein
MWVPGLTVPRLGDGQRWSAVDARCFPIWLDPYGFVVFLLVVYVFVRPSTNGVHPRPLLFAAYGSSTRTTYHFLSALVCFQVTQTIAGQMIYFAMCARSVGDKQP